MKHLKLKYALASLILMFNVAVCVTATVAWFVSAKRLDTSGLQLQIYTYDVDMSYSVYKYSDDVKEAIEVTGAPDAFSLPKYDSVITSRNEHSPIIVRFYITGVTLQDNLPFYINVHCNDQTTTNRVLSNILQIQLANTNEITANTANGIYNEALEYFEDNSVAARTFKANSVKSNDISYTISNYQNQIVNNALSIYVKFDYSPILIEDFDFDLTDSTTTSFTNDLTTINCYTND